MIRKLDFEARGRLVLRTPILSPLTLPARLVAPYWAPALNDGLTTEIPSRSDITWHLVFHGEHLPLPKKSLMITDASKNFKIYHLIWDNDEVDTSLLAYGWKWDFSLAANSSAEIVIWICFDILLRNTWWKRNRQQSVSKIIVQLTNNI